MSGTSRPDIRRELLGLVESSQERVLISALEANDPALLNAIVRKRKANPKMDIRVVICRSKANIWMGSRRFQIPRSGGFAEALRQAGVETRVYAVEGAYNHSRLALVDGRGYLGSGDFTRRSFDGNVEFGALLSGRADIRGLQDGFEHLWSASNPHVRPTLRERIVERSYFFMETLTIALFRLRVLWGASLENRRTSGGPES